MAKPRGRLEVVATPIGNLQDLSDRARAPLAQADVIAAEDTRHTLALLQSIGGPSSAGVAACTQSQRVPELMARLEAGEVVALVSDAGTPLLSDPGFGLVEKAGDAGFDVRVVPGPSAITAAFVIARVPTERFCFEGFLPAHARERKTRLEALANEPRTLVFFQAPHRIAATLEDLAEVFGTERRAAVARELTKIHETLYRGTLAQLLERARYEENFQRGEITLVVQRAESSPAQADEQTVRKTLAVLLRELPLGKAASVAAQLTGVKRNEAYAIALRISTSPGDSAAESQSVDS